MSSTDLRFAGRAEHRAWVESQAALPAGFRAGVARFEFLPVELPRPARMNLVLVALDRPTPAFAACFTRNAFPGAPVLIGRRRLDGPAARCAGGEQQGLERLRPGRRGVGRAALRRRGEAAGAGAGGGAAGLDRRHRLAAPGGADGGGAARGRGSAAAPERVCPAAEAILTTDLYPKVRRAAVGEGSIVGFAKGAGMIEPNLATMLVFLLTDVDVPREGLRAALASAVEGTFNRHLDRLRHQHLRQRGAALLAGAAGPGPRGCSRPRCGPVCADLAEDVVRNGEGVHHVIRVAVSGAADERAARRHRARRSSTRRSSRRR